MGGSETFPCKWSSNCTPAKVNNKLISLCKYLAISTLELKEMGSNIKFLPTLFIILSSSGFHGDHATLVKLKKINILILINICYFEYTRFYSLHIINIQGMYIIHIQGVSGKLTIVKMYRKL